MPFIGRVNSNYPVHPQFGNDPSVFNNVFAITFEQDVFAPAQVLNYQFKTGSSEIRVYDMAVEFIESEVDFQVIEGATCTDGVTQVIPGNADRNSTFVSSVYASSDPTGISGGTTAISFEHFGLPSPIIGIGDLPPATVNYITLKYNTNHIFRFTNVGSVPINDMRFLLLWAE